MYFAKIRDNSIFLALYFAFTILYFHYTKKQLKSHIVFAKILLQPYLSHLCSTIKSHNHKTSIIKHNKRCQKIYC